MIVLLLIGFAVYLHKREATAWELLRQARGHEALRNMQDPGYEVAKGWADRTEKLAGQAKNRTEGTEGVAMHIGRWVLRLFGALAVLRIAASAFRAQAATVGDAGMLAAWDVVVDGIDVLIALVAIA